MRVRYTPHYFDHPEGGIFLGKDKAGACMLILQGAFSMSQEELDYYGQICADALSKAKEWSQ